MCNETAQTGHSQNKGKNEVKFEHFDDFHDVALRILLVDDKVGGDVKDCPAKKPNYLDVTGLNNQLSVKKCPVVDCGKKQCKLCTIKRLMDGSDKNDGKNSEFVFDKIGESIDYFYWKEKDIECYCCPTVIKDFIDEDSKTLMDYTEIILTETGKASKGISSSNAKEKTLAIQGSFQPIQDLTDNKNKPQKNINKVQLVGVKDVRTALLLLSQYKFDMLFIDYLLDKKIDGDKECGREYSIQFFEFLSTDYDKKAEDESVNEKKKKFQLLAKLRHAVLDNRGPLDKLWIMPITGFNSPFIQTLQNKNVPLISTRWHIENGADPITTPWQFLVKLNQFIELQLKGCTYKMEQLITFLTFSGANLKKAYPYKKISNHRRKSNRSFNPPDCHFHDFQAFMGAEFSNFISHFGARPVIRRDAMIEGGDITNKSVFSTYVWNKFYTGDESNKNKKEALFALHNLMQIFYQVAATMPEDRNGVLRLRESFRRLRYYIEIHDLHMQKEAKLDKKEFDESLSFIADCIDVLLEEKTDKKG